MAVDTFPIPTMVLATQLHLRQLRSRRKPKETYKLPEPTRSTSTSRLTTRINNVCRSQMQMMVNMRVTPGPTRMSLSLSSHFSFSTFLSLPRPSGYIPVLLLGQLVGNMVSSGTERPTSNGSRNPLIDPWLVDVIPFDGTARGRIDTVAGVPRIGDSSIRSS
jgi:hypothetical protein